MSSTELQVKQSETVRKHKEFLFPAVAMYYQEPLALVRGEGFHVWDDQDNKYLDCFGGVLTVSVGHANPRVTAAIINQVKTISHTSTLYANKPQSDLAEKLYQITPGNLKKSFFTNSGTEADDTAIMPPSWPQTARNVCCATAIAAVRPLPFPMGHSPGGRCRASLRHRACAGALCYRCPFKLTYPVRPRLCRRHRKLIMTTTTGEIAAFMAEPIPELVVCCSTTRLFRTRCEIARKHGRLFIADEVQTAWGRTGDKWFGIEHWDVSRTYYLGQGPRQWRTDQHHGSHR
jgi:4-aminobutyrate aminotransferase